MEEAVVSAIESSELKRNTGRTSRVAADDNMVRIATKLPYVLLDPFESFALVSKAVVPRNYFFASQEAIRSYTVVERYYYDVHPAGPHEARASVSRYKSISFSSLDEARPVVVRIAVRIKATTLNEEATTYRVSLSQLFRRFATYNTGSLEYLVALLGAYTSKKRQSSLLVLVGGPAAVPKHVGPCVFAITVLPLLTGS